MVDRTKNPERAAALHDVNERQKRLLGEFLTDLTRGDVLVLYDATGMIDSGPDSRGHVYTGYLKPGSGTDIITLDGRDGDLASQLVDELHRISTLYLRLAGRVQQSLAALAGKPAVPEEVALQAWQAARSGGQADQGEEPAGPPADSGDGHEHGAA